MRYRNFLWQSLILFVLGGLVFASGCTLAYTGTTWNMCRSRDDSRVFAALTFNEDTHIYELSVAKTGQDINTGHTVISGYSNYMGRWEPTSDNHFVMDLSQLPNSYSISQDPTRVEFFYDSYYPRINLLDARGNSAAVFYPDFDTYKKYTPAVASDSSPLPPGPTIIEIPVTG
jgi:hypothetical protein